MRLFLSIFLIVATVAQPVLAQNRSSEELSYQRMLDKLERLEKDMNLVQKELYRKDEPSETGKKNSSLWSSWSKKDDAAAPRIEAMLTGLEEDIRKLQGRIEENEFTMNSLAQKLDKIIADLDYRVSAVENNNTLPHIASQNAPSATPSGGSPVELEPAAGNMMAPLPKEVIGTVQPDVTGDDPSVQYEKAFALLRKADYDKAEIALKTFIEKNPDNSLVGNAYYWLGETFYVRENYQQAAVNFLKGYQDFPNGNKVSDNLLKLAMSLAKLGKKQEACTTFNKLIKEFPKADKDVKTKVEAEKKALQC